MLLCIPNAHDRTYQAQITHFDKMCTENWKTQRRHERKTKNTHTEWLKQMNGRQGGRAVERARDRTGGGKNCHQKYSAVQCPSHSTSVFIYIPRSCDFSAIKCTWLRSVALSYSPFAMTLSLSLYIFLVAVCANHLINLSPMLHIFHFVCAVHSFHFPSLLLSRTL